jgi:hypothetical protein
MPGFSGNRVFGGRNQPAFRISATYYIANIEVE